ncbi:MAG: L,D-transpeptidase family protein [Acidimicrobiales bacterium]|jgi:peptidoglycan hydrolase-like protein with peptidoglycan-binding domain
MGEAEATETTTRRRPWRVLGLVAGFILVVALAGAATLIGLQRYDHAAAADDPAKTSSSLPKNKVAPTPLRVTDVSPTSGAKGVAFDTSVTVAFSQPLASDSRLPSLSPAPPGRWVRVAPAAVRFVPEGNFAPFSAVKVVVPGGPNGVRSQYGQDLATTLQRNFVIEGASELRLQQLLAELDYLPVAFVPAAATTEPAVSVATQAWSLAQGKQTTTTTTTASIPAVDYEPTIAAEVPVQPVAGSFVWRFTGMPASLTSLWQPGRSNVITTGAIMAFESANRLPDDGIAGPAVWSALLQAVAQRHLNADPYDYVSVSQVIPERASVWRNGHVIYTTLVNTGIPAAPTAVGTYPVYARYVVTTMVGKNPDGTPYSDPGIPWVSYFHGGDALHGYIRAYYGFPQSLGCVEMPYPNAAVMYPLTPIGTLVTVL